MSEATKVPKRVMPFLVAWLIAGIAMPAVLLYHIRSRLDLSVWLWGLLLIACLFAISVPLALWLEKRKKRSGSFPWPTAASNPHFGKGTSQQISFEGTLTWTPKIFRRMVRAFVRHTPAGRNHRRTIYILSLIGATGVVLGTVVVYQREMGGPGPIAASALLIAFTYSLRARVPKEIRSGVQVHWTLSQGRFTMRPINLRVIPRRGQSTLVRSTEIHLSRARAIVRTPAGFIIWPHDLIEFWMPNEAFATVERVESFHEIARSCVANYVYESDGR